LEKKLQIEKKQADHLAHKIMTADKPRFGKAARDAAKAESLARSPNGVSGVEARFESFDNGAPRSPSMIPVLKTNLGTPNRPGNVRYELFGCLQSRILATAMAYLQVWKHEHACIATSGTHGRQINWHALETLLNTKALLQCCAVLCCTMTPCNASKF
jgi:hypothetical protein